MSYSQPDLEKGIVHHSDSSHNLAAQPTYNSDNDFDCQALKDDSAPTITRTLTKVTTDGDIIYLGHQAFHRNELMNAFGGEFRAGIHPAPHRPMGNPVPLGLVGYSICTFVLGMVVAQVRDAKSPQIFASAGMFLGGLVTLICGFWCLIVENTFAATALGAFGGFYMTYAGILIDAFGIATYAAQSPDDFNSVMGFFLLAWFFFSFIMWTCTFKSTWSFFFVIGFITWYLFFLSIGYFLDNFGLKRTAGILAVLSSLCGFYAIFEGIATAENSYLQAPSLLLPGAPRV